MCKWRDILGATRDVAKASERADKLARRADIPLTSNGLIHRDRAFFFARRSVQRQGAKAQRREEDFFLCAFASWRLGVDFFLNDGIQ